MTEQQLQIIRTIRADQQRIASGAITKIEKLAIEQVHMELFSEGINRGCGACWIKAIYRITIELDIESEFLNQKPNYKAMSNFLLKENKLLMSHGSSDGMTNANITDAKVIDRLKRVPASKREAWLQRNFAKFPDNWNELLNTPAGDVTEKIPAVVISPAVTKTEAPKTSPVKELDNMSRNELLAEAERLKLPKEEYNRKNKNALLVYLKDKQKAKTA